MKTYILLLLFLASSSAQAEKTIGDILGNIKSQSRRVKIDKSKTNLPQYQGYQKRTVVNLNQIKPPSSNSIQRDESEEAQIEAYTDKEIQQLYMLTKKYRRSRTRGEIWLRLAEAYVDKAKTVEFRIQREYDKQLEIYQAGKTKRKPTLNTDEALQYNKKAIQLYEWFLRDFPKDEKVDQALFFLGYNHFELNNIKKGLGFYNRLIKEFPKSPYIDEAHFALGEYYFENEDWGSANGYYVKVASRKKSRLYSFSLYKASWCFFKLGKVNEALNYLVRVIKAGQDFGTKGKKIRLVDEAKANLIPFYAELPGYQNARKFFSSVVSKDEMTKMIEKLAYYYSDTGRRQAARYYFRDLIERDPSAPKAYDYQYQIVTMYSSAGDVKTFKKEMFDWVDRYGPKSRWARKNSKDFGDLVKKSVDLVETTLRTYTLQHHQTAQNSRGKSSTSLAVLGYEKYFQAFDETKYMGDMHFYFGELLFDMKEYERAAFHYLWVSDHDPKNQFYEKAILNAILALEKKLPDSKGIKKVVGKSDIPIPLDKTTRIFEKVAARYFKLFPKGKNATAVKYKLASLYYAYNHDKKALELFEDISINYPANEYTESSGHIVLDIYNQNKDFDGLEQAATKMLEKPEVKKSKFGSQVREILVRTNFKRAQDKIVSKDYLAGAELFKSFADKFPDSTLAVSAIYNAAVNFEKSGKMAESVALYERLGKYKGKQAISLNEKSRKFLATIYQNTGQYKKAAAAFEESAYRETNKSIKADYFYNAAILRKGMRFYSLAEKNFDNYYKYEPSRDKLEAIYFKGQMWEERGKPLKALDYYKRYVEMNPSDAGHVIESTFKVAKYYERFKNIKRADEWYGKTIAIHKNFADKGKNIGVQYAAEAKFYFVYKTYIELKGIKFTSNQSQQAKALNQKIAIIDRLNKELQQVIKYNDGFQIVAALATAGQAYQHMSASLFSIPPPKGLDKDSLEAYKKQIGELAKPFTDKAIENYKAAIEKASLFESYSSWVMTATSELNRMDSTLYPDAGEVAFITRLPDNYGEAADTSKVEGDLIKALEKSIEASDDEAAEKAIVAILSADSNDLFAINQLILLNMRKKRYGLCRVLIDKALGLKSNDKVILNNLGVLELEENKMRDAVKAFRLSIKADVSYRMAATNLGSIYLEYKDYSRALSPLEDGYKLTKSALKKGVKFAVEVANNYALALKGMGKYSASEDIFEEIIEYENRNVSVLLNYAILLVENLKSKDKAIKVLSRIKVIEDNVSILKKVKELEKKVFDGPA